MSKTCVRPILALFCLVAAGLALVQAQPAGTRPATASAAGEITFQDVTAEMGITNFQKVTKPEWPVCPQDEEHHYIHWPFNLCVGDFLGDGSIGLFCGQHGEPANGFSHLFLLDRKTGKFTIFRGDKVITPTPRQGRGAYISGVVDADDDGRLDIVMADGDTSGSILLNRATATGPAFEKMAFASPSGLAFADLDHTGGLDTVVSSADTLAVFRGVNTDPKNRIATGIPVFGTRHSTVVLADLNNDGFDDILYAEIGARGASTRPSDRKDRLRLFLNLGGMKFKEVTAEAGLGKCCTGQIAVGDLNNDGNLDLIVMGTENTDNPDGGFKIYLNDGQARFTDVTGKADLKSPLRPRQRWGWEFDMRFNMVLADLDNDGLQELVTSPNYGYYRNRGDGTFEDFALLKTNGPGNGIVCAADFHNAGRLDLALLTADQTPVHILQNQTQNPNKWLKVQLRQKDKNVFALGAKVFAYRPGMLGDAKGQIAMRELMSNAMNLVEFATLHLGVGPNDKVDLRVVFPNGKVVEKAGVPTNQVLKIADSEATRTVEFKAQPFQAAATKPG